MDIALILVGLVLGMLETGYVFRIVEESVNGSTKLPKFDRLNDMFIHGIKELVIIFAYLAVPVGLFIGLYLLGLNFGMLHESFRHIYSDSGNFHYGFHIHSFPCCYIEHGP